MASLFFVSSPPLARWQLKWPAPVSSKFVWLQDLRSQRKWTLKAAPKRIAAKSREQDSSTDENTTVTKRAGRASKQAPKRRSRKASFEALEDNSALEVHSDSESNTVNNTDAEVVSDAEEGTLTVISSDEEPKKTTKRSRGRASPSKGTSEKVARKRRARKKIDTVGSESGSEDAGGSVESKLSNMDDKPAEDKKKDKQRSQHDEEDISFSYGWPPLVCCFGAAQYGFLPSGRPASRLIDHEMHESKKDVFWSPEKFVRAPGGPSSNVALSLVGLGGRVAFMGKLGDDEYGQAMLYYLNVNGVQSRAVKIDTSKPTSVSYMKISRRGNLKATCVQPCVEDCLSISEINIDVLKEAKMFYFNSSSLLDPDIRSTTLKAIEISKHFGGSIFFDLNLPLPLWKSNDETKALIKEAWAQADFIEVSKQELEFLCGIKPTEKFDTKDNDASKFVHYSPEVVKPLWHSNLKVLFVTNGTSKIHFYTEKDHSFVRGMEDAPITPFTGDMSASGDAIVAAFMRMLTVQPHLATDKKYLQHIIKYACTCGAIDQWIVGRVRGFPPKEGVQVDGVKSITEREWRTVGPLSPS